MLNETYADNGEFSHEQIIDADTGVILFSCDSEEQIAIDEKKRMALLQKVVERLDVHLKALPGPIKCGLSDNYKEFILETKLEA
jgi:hypothetical protein